MANRIRLSLVEVLFIFVLVAVLSLQAYKQYQHHVERHAIGHFQKTLNVLWHGLNHYFFRHCDQAWGSFLHKPTLAQLISEGDIPESSVDSIVNPWAFKKTPEQGFFLSLSRVESGLSFALSITMSFDRLHHPEHHLPFLQKRLQAATLDDVHGYLSWFATPRRAFLSEDMPQRSSDWLRPESGAEEIACFAEKKHLSTHSVER